MASVEGHATERFAGLRDILQRNLDNGDDLGASVAVYHHGELVADLWGGYADEARTTPWQRDTIVNVWSTTKTMTFLCALLLHDRGELDFFAPVADYWPEFARHGKEAIEVQHVLNHTAGLPGFTSAISVDDLWDWDRCVDDLVDQAPWWSDRSQSAYHAVTQGFLIGEIVRRITGQSFGQFLRAELAEPLGADFFVGLPESEEPRVSLVCADASMDPESLEPADSLLARVLLAPPLHPVLPRQRAWRAAEIPAANGHGNARSVGQIQQIIANNGVVDGRRFLRESTIDELFVPRVRGVDGVLNFDVTFGLGYGLSSSAVPLGPHACYWGGYGGSVCIMDREREFVVVYAMNLMRAGLVGDLRGGEFALAAAMAASA